MNSLLCTAPVVELPLHQVALHQVDVLVAGRTFVAQGARLKRSIGRRVLEESGRAGERGLAGTDPKPLNNTTSHSFSVDLCGVSPGRRGRGRPRDVGGRRGAVLSGRFGQGKHLRRHRLVLLAGGPPGGVSGRPLYAPHAADCERETGETGREGDRGGDAAQRGGGTHSGSVRGSSCSTGTRTSGC